MREVRVNPNDVKRCDLCLKECSKPTCSPCDQIDMAHTERWLELEKQMVGLTGAEER